MVELSTVVMAHPARKDWAESLATELGAQIVWDEIGHPWDTGRRALLAGAGTHVMVIQDDAIASEGLVESVHRAVQYSGDNPVGLYASASKHVATVMGLEPKAWWIGQGPTWGVGVVIPTADVRSLVKFGDLYKSRSYDQRLWHFYQGQDCWYTVPSLVDHRVGHGSLLGKGRDRHAQTFGSGLEVDWSAPPVDGRKHAVYPTVRMSKDGITRTARKNTTMWRRLIGLGWVEQ